MKQLFIFLFFAAVTAGCGDDNNLADSGGIAIVDDTFTVSANDYRQFSFPLPDVQQNAYIQGKFEVKNGSIEFAVMNESTYQSWLQGESLSTVFYSPGAAVSSDEFQLNFNTSGTYYVVFTNRQSEARTIEAQVYLFATLEEE